MHPKYSIGSLQFGSYHEFRQQIKGTDTGAITHFSVGLKHKMRYSNSNHNNDLQKVFQSH